MRTLALVLLVIGTVGCNSAITPTAPTLPAVAAAPVGSQSVCTPPATGRVYAVPVPGHATPAYVWLESVSPAVGATVRVGDQYTLSYRQVTPPGYKVSVDWSVGNGGEERRSNSVVSAGGCGSGTFRSQVPPNAGSWQLRVRVWVEAGDVALSFMPTRPPDFEAAEPLDWTVAS